jgi:hypothetical protein
MLLGVDSSPVVIPDEQTVIVCIKGKNWLLLLLWCLEKGVTGLDVDPASRQPDHVWPGLGSKRLGSLGIRIGLVRREIRVIGNAQISQACNYFGCIHNESQDASWNGLLRPFRLAAPRLPHPDCLA